MMGDEFGRKNPSGKVIFIEKIMSITRNNGADECRFHPVRGCCGTKPGQLVGSLAYSHNDRSTLGYTDGHAEKWKWYDNGPSSSP
jgi:prepilin-type processing-associated H-X9-DG protein